MSDEPTAPTRRVHCEDALPWLARHTPLAGCSIITSLPDVSGSRGMTLEAWSTWFIEAAGAVLAATPPEGVAIFYQTDIKRDGLWIDKGRLCQRAAEARGVPQLWHKIVCRHAPGHPAFGRPSYAHMLCFSLGVRDVAHAYPDVLPSAGAASWSRGMGLEACRLACDYVRSHTSTRRIVDPFCGQGTVLAMANAIGLDAVGVELGHRRVEKARVMQI